MNCIMYDDACPMTLARVIYMHDMLKYVMLFDVILCYIMLCYVMTYYDMLCYDKLCHVIKLSFCSYVMFYKIIIKSIIYDA